MSMAITTKGLLHVDHALAEARHAIRALERMHDAGAADPSNALTAVAFLDTATTFARHAHELALAGQEVAA